MLDMAENPLYNLIIKRKEEKVKVNIKRLRLKYKGTKTDLAKALGLTIADYTKLEDGVVEPTAKQIKKLAYIYNVSEEDIMFDDKPQDAVEQKVVEEPKVENKNINSTYSKTLNIFIIVLSSIYLVLNVIPLIQGFAYLDILQSEAIMICKVPVFVGLLSAIFALTLSIAYLASNNGWFARHSKGLSLASMVASFVAVFFGIVFLLYVGALVSLWITLLMGAIATLCTVNYVKIKKEKN